MIGITEWFQNFWFYRTIISNDVKNRIDNQRLFKSEHYSTHDSRWENVIFCVVSPYHAVIYKTIDSMFANETYTDFIYSVLLQTCNLAI